MGLQTIQVEIDATGHILPMEPLPFKRVDRALLTLLDATIETMPLPKSRQMMNAAVWLVH